MTRTLTTGVLALATTAILAPTAMADEKEPHRDVWVSVGADGRLAIGAVEEAEGGGEIFEAGVRVFGAELGEEDPMFPFSGDEPGFEMEDGEVAAGTPFTFLLDGPVTKWNGAGYDPTTVFVNIEFGPASVQSGDTFQPGFTFTADAAGGFHDHFEYTLADAGGGDPAAGIYLLPMRLAMVGMDSASDTFWIVFNLEQEEVDHEAAIEWVENERAGGCAADLDDSGSVDFDDLLSVLAAWGSCP